MASSASDLAAPLAAFGSVPPPELLREDDDRLAGALQLSICSARQARPANQLGRTEAQQAPANAAFHAAPGNRAEIAVSARQVTRGGPAHAAGWPVPADARNPVRERPPVQCFVSR
jgi:hypothetical protein